MQLVWKPFLEKTIYGGRGRAKKINMTLRRVNRRRRCRRPPKNV